MTPDADIDMGQYYSGNGLLSDNTKPLHEPMWTSIQWDSVALT